MKPINIFAVSATLAIAPPALAQVMTPMEYVMTAGASNLGTHINVPRGADCGATTAPDAVMAASRRGFEVIRPENAVAGRSYPVAARRSWKTRRSMLYARLASVIFASARAMPMVRTNSPI